MAILLWALALAAGGAAACYSGQFTSALGTARGSLSLQSATRELNIGPTGGVCFGNACGGSRLNRMYKLTIPSAFSLGGTLTVSTCSSYTNFDTTLALGYATVADNVCASETFWTETQSDVNDDDTGCTFRTVLSTVVRAGVQRRVWYIAVGAFSESSSSAGTGNFDLSWSYETAPAPSQSGTRAPAPSQTGTRAPAPSQTGTRAPAPSSSQTGTRAPEPYFGVPIQTCTVSFTLPSTALCPLILGQYYSAQVCAAGGYRVTETYNVYTGEEYIIIEGGLSGCNDGYGVRRSDGSGVYDVYLWSVPGVFVTARASTISGSMDVQVAYPAAGATCSWSYTLTSGSCLGTTVRAVASNSGTNIIIGAVVGGVALLAGVGVAVFFTLRHRAQAMAAATDLKSVPASSSDGAVADGSSAHVNPMMKTATGTGPQWQPEHLQSAPHNGGALFVRHVAPTTTGSV